MAKLKKLPPPDPPPPVYQLELTEREAQILCSLLGRCMGGGLTSSIWDALDRGGVNCDRFKVDVTGLSIRVLEQRSI